VASKTTPGKPLTPTKLPGRPVMWVGGTRPGWVTFGSDDPAMHVIARVSDKVDLSNGAGGWDQIDRKRRKSITEYKGGPGWQLDIPCLFDGWQSGTPVDSDVKTLEAMAVPAVGEIEPPKLHVDGGGAIPHDFWNDPETLWVIDSFSWGDSLAVGNIRYRQQVTVTVVEYIDEEVLPEAKKKASTKKHRTYVLKKGDTLQKIAKHFYRSAAKWKDIAKLNNIRDPNHPGRPGKRIKLP
jgi:LysM repeat protein